MPQYEDVYEPPVLDSTFSNKMDELKAAMSPQASGVHVSTANMHYITEDDAQGALAELDAEAYAINSSLAQKQDAITLTALSNGNYGSFENGGYFTIGNLVIFDVTFTVGSGGATTGQNLVTGFPSISQNDKPFFCMMMGSVNNDLKAVRIYQTGLYPNSNFGAGRYHAYGMYIKS